MHFNSCCLIVWATVNTALNCLQARFAGLVLFLPKGLPLLRRTGPSFMLIFAYVGAWPPFTEQCSVKTPSSEVAVYVLAGSHRSNGDVCVPQSLVGTRGLGSLDYAERKRGWLVNFCFKKSCFLKWRSLQLKIVELNDILLWRPLLFMLRKRSSVPVLRYSFTWQWGGVGCSPKQLTSIEVFTLLLYNLKVFEEFIMHFNYIFLHLILSTITT